MLVVCRLDGKRGVLEHFFGDDDYSRGAVLETDLADPEKTRRHARTLESAGFSVLVVPVGVSALRYKQFRLANPDIRTVSSRWPSVPYLSVGQAGETGRMIGEVLEETAAFLADNRSGLEETGLPEE